MLSGWSKVRFGLVQSCSCWSKVRLGLVSGVSGGLGVAWFRAGLGLLQGLLQGGLGLV